MEKGLSPTLVNAPQDPTSAEVQAALAANEELKLLAENAHPNVGSMAEHAMSPADFAYTSACTPERTLALLATIEALQERLDRALADLAKLRQIRVLKATKKKL